MMNSNKVSHTLTLLALGLLWCVVTIVILEKTGCVIVDGFQSLGAAAQSRFPGDLRWDGLGGFMGYDRTWGFHWFGWPLAYSFLSSLCGWFSLQATIVVTALWFCSALLVRRLWTLDSPDRVRFYGSIVLMMALLMQPLFLVAAQSFRPEIATACLLLLWAHDCTVPNRVGTFLRRRVLLAILPSFHPLGFVVPLAWMIWQGFSCYRKRRIISRNDCMDLLVLLAGLALFSCWYLRADMAAGRQLVSNIQQQAVLTRAMDLSYDALLSKGFLTMPMKLAWPWLLLATLYACYAIVKKNTDTIAARVNQLSAIAWYSALAFLIVTKNPNPLHLVAVLPFALMLSATAVSDSYSYLQRNYLRFSLLLLLCACLCITSLMMAKRLYLLTSLGYSYRAELRSLYMEQAQKTAGTIYIPVSLWEVACEQRNNFNYRFSTFPNILVTEQRIASEQRVFAEAIAGDLCIIDEHQEIAGVFNEYPETALKQKWCLPWKSEQWEKVEVIRLSSKGVQGTSSEFTVYRKK